MSVKLWYNCEHILTINIYINICTSNWIEVCFHSYCYFMLFDVMRCYVIRILLYCSFFPVSAKKTRVLCYSLLSLSDLCWFGSKAEAYYDKIPSLRPSHCPPSSPVQPHLALSASERRQTFPEWCELSENKTDSLRTQQTVLYNQILYNSCFLICVCVFFFVCVCVHVCKPHTYFPPRMNFAQTVSLVLHRPLLEQLLEESRLGPVIHHLDVCCTRVVFGLDELLQQPATNKTHDIHSVARLLRTPGTRLTWCDRLGAAKPNQSWSTHQSSGHCNLPLSLVGFLPLPHKDLRPSLIQEVAILNGLLRYDIKLIQSIL